MLCLKTGTWAQLGEGGVSENRHLGFKRFILFKNWIMFFFQLRSKNLQNLNAIQFLQVLDSVLSYSDIWGSRNDSYRDNIWELPRDCDQTVMMTTMPTIMWDPVVMVDGLPYSKGVSAWFGCLLHSLYTHNLCWASAKKAQGLPRHSIAVVPELCFFISQKVFFSVMKISLPVEITLKKI